MPMLSASILGSLEQKQAIVEHILVKEVDKYGWMTYDALEMNTVPSAVAKPHLVDTIAGIVKMLE